MNEIRREARERGLDWNAVRQAAAEVRDAEREKRQRPNEVRETAWIMATACTPASWPFWRHGFYSRWGRRIARGADYTVIPRYDEIAQEVGWYFPEYSGDDGTERLFEFLLSPYDKLPTREEIYRKAMDLVECHKAMDLVECHQPAAIPF